MDGSWLTTGEKDEARRSFCFGVVSLTGPPSLARSLTPTHTVANFYVSYAVYTHKPQYTAYTGAYHIYSPYILTLRGHMPLSSILHLLRVSRLFLRWLIAIGCSSHYWLLRYFATVLRCRVSGHSILPSSACPIADHTKPQVGWAAWEHAVSASVQHQSGTS